MRALVLRLGIGACLVGIVAGCGEPPVPPRPLAIGLVTEPIGLDPHLHSDFHTSVVLSNIYEGLTSFDAQLHVGAALAASWENPNNTTWLFHLRPGVQFHDGRPLQAEDVVFSLERAAHLPASDARSYLVPVKSVRALDQRTVEIVTEHPAATLLKKLAFVSIVPRGSPSEIRHPVGTGPYVLLSWTPGKHIELRAFDRYWGPRAVEKTVWLVPIKDDAARARSVEAGDLDVAAGLSAPAAATLKSKPCCRVEVHDSLLVWHLEVRVDRLPFSDSRVRQALNVAIDRARLLQQIVGGEGRAAGQLVTNNDVGYAPDIVPPARDLVRARALLAAAGYPQGLDTELEFREGSRAPVELQAQLAEAGIRVKLVPRAWNEFYSRLEAGQAVLALASVLAESGDASDVLDSMAHSRGTAVGYGDNNASAYSNHALDEMIERTGLMVDPLRRRELLQRCMRTFTSDLPTIPLYVLFDLYGVRKGVSWHPRLDAEVLAAEVRRTGAAD